VVEEQRYLNHDRWMSVVLDLAESAMSRGDFPVGCILVSGDTLVGSGSRSHSRARELNELDHAEISAIRDWIARKRPLGYGDDVTLTAYCNLEPCLMCLGAMILNGIRRIVYAYEDVMGGASGLDFSRPLSAAGIREGDLYIESHIEIIRGVKRRESLALFKRFFSNPANAYWKDSLLYRYTLNTTC